MSNNHQRKSLNHHNHHQHGIISNVDDAVVDIINNSSRTNSSLMSDKIIASNSNSKNVNDLNGNVALPKEKHFFNNIDNVAKKHENLTKEVIMHRNRHYRKKHKLSNSKNDDNLVHDYHRTSEGNWEEKIRSGFMGYDLPYPPNEFSVNDFLNLVAIFFFFSML